jgi:PAS domain S-box-containing protein
MPHRVVASEELTLLVDMARTQESVFAVDAACRIVFLNEHAEALLGYRASDVIGGRCCDALHFSGEPGSPICGLCIRALATPESPPFSSRFEVSATTSTGAHIRLRILALPAYNAAGQLRTVHVLRALSPEESAHGDEAAAVDDLSRAALRPAHVGAHEADITSEQPHQSAQPHQLTRRELEVLKLLAGGLSTANIAAQLSISPITARNHVTSIIEKLGAKTRLQAVVMASRMGLLLESKL